MPRLSPVNQARWARFRHNRRGYWSLWIFAVLFALSMCSELIANDKPLLVHFNDRWYVPVIANYSESDFGGPFATPAEYQDPWLRQQIEQPIRRLGLLLQDVGAEPERETKGRERMPQAQILRVAVRLLDPVRSVFSVRRIHALRRNQNLWSGRPVRHDDVDLLQILLAQDRRRR